MITGTTHLVGLIGWPVSHSLSPVMHNAAFDKLGLTWRYVPLPVPPGSESAAVSGLSALGFTGANVTVPHKTLVMAHLDSLSDDAKAIGAVNTLVIRETDDGIRAAHGHNTNCAGFVSSLQRAGLSIAGERAVVCGAGGAARAVVFGLMAAGAADIVMLSRSVEQAERVISDLQIEPRYRIRALPLEPEALIASARDAALFINATPIGMTPAVAESPWPRDAAIPSELTVYDLVYAPTETLLLKQAREAGAGTISGLEMLIEQGAKSFELWTGKQAPIDEMRRACTQATEGG